MWDTAGLDGTPMPRASGFSPAVPQRPGGAAFQPGALPMMPMMPGSIITAGGASHPSDFEDRQARRLYLGGVPRGLVDFQIIGFMNQELVDKGLTEASSPWVVSATTLPEKNFCFIEFDTAEHATQAMALDGVLFQV